jgi:hypothetical protein
MIEGLSFALVIAGVMLIPAVIAWFAIGRRPTLREHSGECDRCSQYGMIWLDRVGILCWDHYCEEMAAQRARNEQSAQEKDR